MTEPKDVTAYRKGVSLFKAGKVLEALKYFRFAAESGEDRPMEHFALASALLQVNELSAAREEYEKFLRFESGLGDKERAAGLALAGIEARLRKEVSAPVSVVQEPTAPAGSGESIGGHEERLVEESQLEPDPQPPERGRDRLEEARKGFDEALNFYRAGGYDPALERLIKVADVWGQTPELLNLMGLCHLHRKDFGAAEAALMRALELDPEGVEARINLSRLWFEQGCVRARSTLEEVLVRHRRNREAWFNLGIVTGAQGDLSRAQESFEAVLELDPEDEAAQSNLKDITRRLR